MSVEGSGGRESWVEADDFEMFYRAEMMSVYRALAATLRDRELAEEATAESMTRCYQHWGKVSGYDNPAGWCYRVGLNWAISRLRRRRLLPFDRSQAVAPEPDVFDPTLEKALRDLDVSHRAVIVLRYLWDLPQADIAKALGIPVGTVKSRINRGLTHLREVIEQ